MDDAGEPCAGDCACCAADKGEMIAHCKADVIYRNEANDHGD